MGSQFLVQYIRLLKVLYFRKLKVQKLHKERAWSRPLVFEYPYFYTLMEEQIRFLFFSEDQLPEEILNAPKRGFNLALAPWITQNPRFAPSRIWKLLNQQALPFHLSRRSFWGSWFLLLLSGRYKPYWRYVVLAEWLAQW